MRGKKPTRKQKAALSYVRLNINNWLVIKTFPDKFRVKHRYTGTEKDIPN